MNKTLQKIPAKSSWHLAIRNIMRQKNRSMICLLTIAGGVLSLLLFEGFNQGALWQYQELVVHSRVGHFQMNKKVNEDVLSTDLQSVLIEDYSPLEEKIKKLPTVDNVFPRLRLSGLLTNAQKSLPVLAEGIDPEKENPFFHKLEYLQGSALPIDSSDGVVIGEGIAKGLQVSIGSRITLLAQTLSGSLNAIDLVVVGTFRSGVKEFDEGFIRLNLKAAQDLLQTKGVSQLNIGLKRSEDLQKAWPALRETLPGEFTLQDFVQLDDIYYGNSVRWLKAQFLFIRLIIYLVVIMGILNTVNITIHERTSEIGTMRAMGFGKKFIQKQFLREYAILGLTGALTGVLLAITLKHLLFVGIPMPPSPGATKGLLVFLRIGFGDIGLNCLAAVFASILAAYWPARKAAALPIIEALGRKI